MSLDSMVNNNRGMDLSVLDSKAIKGSIEGETNTKLRTPRSILLNATLMALLIVSARMDSSAKQPKEPIQAEADHKPPQEEAEIDKFIARRDTKQKSKIRIYNASLKLTSKSQAAKPQTQLVNSIEPTEVSEIEKFIDQQHKQKSLKTSFDSIEKVETESQLKVDTNQKEAKSISVSTFISPQSEVEFGTQSWRERAERYETTIIETAERHNVDPRLLWTIAFIQTQFRNDLVSPEGARGIMQFMPETARLYKLKDPHNASSSFDAAARHIKDIETRFGKRLDLIFAAYNAGQDSVGAYLEGRSVTLPNGKTINRMGRKTSGIPPYKTTQKFVARAMRVFEDISHKELFPTDLLSEYQRSEMPKPIEVVTSSRNGIKVKKQNPINHQIVESTKEEYTNPAAVTRPRRVVPIEDYIPVPEPELPVYENTDDQILDSPVIATQTPHRTLEKVSPTTIDLPESKTFKESRFRRVSVADYYNLDKSLNQD
jgi:soluble lytic murein transglycosylase-like protein